MREAVSVEKYGAIGDGVRDNSAAFNAAFKENENIYIPDGTYIVGSTVYIPSDTNIIADSGAVIKLGRNAQKGRKDFLLCNSDIEGGNSNICIDGGTWDSNCSENDRGNNLFDPVATTGVMMNFRNVKNLTLKNMTVSNPLCYYLRFCQADGVTIENIRFQTEHLSGNQDGIHMAGFCNDFTIRNLWGAFGSPNDDFLAFNADDCMIRQEKFDVICGPISNVTVDNVSSEGCHCFVRLLSIDSPITNVKISNVSGKCKNVAINMDASRYCKTPVFKDEERPTGVGAIENVLIENMKVSPFLGAEQPVIRMETNCVSFEIRNFELEEGSSLALIRKTDKAELTADGDFGTIQKTVSYGDEISISGKKINHLKITKNKFPN